ncbi:MAG: hypothetical protein KJO26_09665, partial [Deltaproteobacteria bacterium]|nr:hypothetical protein [Deltaproteobacteria bacterium]
MDKIIKVLIVAGTYAPSPVVGGKRFTFLTEALHKNDFEIHVLTKKESYIKKKDTSLPVPGLVHRTGMYPPYRINEKKIAKRIFNRIWADYLCLVDPFSGWVIPSVIKGLSIVKKEKIDVIIATCPMFSTVLIGYLLNVLSGVELIIDYRDPWSNYPQRYPKIFGRLINEYLEKKAISAASALVFCTRMMMEKFEESLGQHANAKRFVVTNGYSGGRVVAPISLGNTKKNMVFAGSLRDERRLNLLAEPLSRLMQEGLITEDNFCFHIFSKLRKEDQDAIDKYFLKDIIQLHSFVPYY